MQVENMNLNHTRLNLRFLREANFESEVLQSKRTVLVAFWAPWSIQAAASAYDLRER